MVPGLATWRFGATGRAITCVAIVQLATYRWILVRCAKVQLRRSLQWTIVQCTIRVHEPEHLPMAMRPRRSVLYVPGDNEHALEKAKTLAADSIIIDLEDSVSPANKEIARRHAISVDPRRRLRHARSRPARQSDRDALGHGRFARGHRVRRRMPYSFRRFLIPATSSARPKSSRPQRQRRTFGFGQ